jgi:uridylate kinase
MSDGGEARPTYHRVLLKLLRRSLRPRLGFRISDGATALVARQLAEVVDLGIQTAVVVGGGNIWRGRQAPGIDRNRADYMGMLATVMNALALQDALEKIHVATARADGDHHEPGGGAVRSARARSAISRRGAL